MTTIAIPSYELGIFPNIQSRTVSSDFSDQYEAETKQSLDKTAASKNLILSDLEEIRQECSVLGWDGYDAAPINTKAVKEAISFIDLLPHYAPFPSVAPAPSGEIALEWKRDKDNILLVTLSGEQNIIYAAILNDISKRHGTEIFIDEIPECIEKLISNFK